MALGSRVHLIEFEPKDQVDVTSLAIDETQLGQVDHLPESIFEPPHIMLPYSFVDSNQAHLLDNTKVEINSTEHSMHANSKLPLMPRV